VEQRHIPEASTDPVKDYLKAIGRVPLLTAEEEVELSKRIEAGLLASKIVIARENRAQGNELSETERHLFDRWRGKAATEQLVWLAEDGQLAKKHMLEANLRLVVSIAKRYTGGNLPMLDLIQEGNAGLVRAVEKFDYEKGFKFSTYATWWIRQAITRGLAEQGRTIRVPVHVAEKISKMNRVQRQLSQDLNREPTLEELSDEVDMSPEEIVNLQRYDRDPISLQALLGDSASSGRGQKEGVFGDLLQDTEAITADEVAQHHEMHDALEAVLDALDMREAEVIRMRFGIGYGRTMKLEEVANRFGVTRERIRQIEQVALTKLRHPALNSGLEDFLD
jgi:RNA polymerase primary sigma factor